MAKLFKLHFFCFLIVAAISCNEEKNTGVATDFEIKDFKPLTNWELNSKNNVKNIELDYFDAINTGFLIPSIRQINEGLFVCSFSIKNNTPALRKFSWKIYYKNESYCFPEKDSTASGMNDFAEENFYGSYEDSSIYFKTTQAIPPDDKFHVINDSIRIVGNPRNEEEFFKYGANNRWQRNPRVGKYSFMLVVTEDENIRDKKIPLYVQNICKKYNDHYFSPYYYFLYGNGKIISNTAVIVAKDSLKVIAHPGLDKGIFVEKKKYKPENLEQPFPPGCGLDTELYRTSCYSQFIHYIDSSTRFENIPVISDVLKDNYSKIDYNWNRSFYKRDELISTTPQIAKYPCETVYSDPVNKKIIIHNPKSVPGKWRKENVGVMTRHGFAYGKMRIKTKLTQLLNKNNVWNGLTNAIWMISQSEENWNLRRPCRKKGYMANYWAGRDDKRVDRVAYSEIDFEILKTPPYCPGESFPPVYKIPEADINNIDKWNVPWPEEITNLDSTISVACTNWDMACWEPKNYGIGCNSVTYNNQTFEAHRWDHWYRAVTEKKPESDDELFDSPYYYFEIEWKPTEIIWRIGPEPDKMRVVGYMNEQMTSIPNNQMILIVTQEFHNTKWWPGSPFQQDNIPFPANDITGEIYDVVIE